MQSNQILNGDCRDELQKLDSNTISCCITDPPYNYEFIGKDWDFSEIQRRLDLAQKSGSSTLVKNIPYGSGLAGGVRNKRWYQKNRDNIINYEEWCYSWGTELFRVCKPGATVAIFNSTRTVAHVQVAMERAGFYARDIVVYKRTSGIPKGINMRGKLEKLGDPNAEKWSGWHSCLRSEWEAIAILQKPLSNNYLETARNFGTGLFYTEAGDGSFQSNIIDDIPKKKSDDFNIHCTVKPLALMRRLVKIFAPTGDNSILLDPFAGSGTTLVAAKEKGISYIGIEMVPEYIKIIEKRLSEVTSEQKTLNF